MRPFTFDSSRRLSRRSSLRSIIAALGNGKTARAGGRLGVAAFVDRGNDMARYEIAGVEGTALGQANAAADMFFDLGMMYSTGRSVPPDLVTAHKWFNIAAMRGNRDAIRLRVEIAGEMSEAEIAAAQRAARDWLSAH
jgi:TPR repeat protein